MSAPPLRPSLAESVRRLVDEDEPRVGHCLVVLEQVGITASDSIRLRDGFGVARRVAGLLLQAGEVAL